MMYYGRYIIYFYHACDLFTNVVKCRYILLNHCLFIIGTRIIYIIFWNWKTRRSIKAELHVPGVQDV